ncbi:ribonuclease H-like domain-containing protein [Hyaloraphidium curvatum]|nr:ribonuclease H-like domain-containing protein [Hyaloraphidium curvatum]
MVWISVDVEADGPCPGEYSMVSLGAVVVEPGLSRTFRGELRPVSDKYVEEALKACDLTREQTMGFPDAKETMEAFAKWVVEVSGKGRPMFVSDNNGFDWMFVNYYLHRFTGSNPFGHSSTNLGSLYKGMQKDCFATFKHLRDTPHTHDPLDDARGNAEALLKMKGMGLRIRLD